jgi:hypothetical protein
MPNRPTLGHSTLSNPYAAAVSFYAVILAVGNIALGAVLNAQPQRFLGGSFAHITGGHAAGVRGWGVGFLVSGCVALFAQWTHRKWPARAAHSASGFGCVFWVIAFAIAGYQDQRVATSGVVAYAIIGAFHITTAVVSPHPPRP